MNGYNVHIRYWLFEIEIHFLGKYDLFRYRFMTRDKDCCNKIIFYRDNNFPHTDSGC